MSFPLVAAQGLARSRGRSPPPWRRAKARSAPVTRTRATPTTTRTTLCSRTSRGFGSTSPTSRGAARPRPRKNAPYRPMCCGEETWPGEGGGAGRTQGAHRAGDRRASRGEECQVNFLPIRYTRPGSAAAPAFYAWPVTASLVSSKVIAFSLMKDRAGSASEFGFSWALLQKERKRERKREFIIPFCFLIFKQHILNGQTPHPRPHPIFFFLLFPLNFIPLYRLQFNDDPCVFAILHAVADFKFESESLAIKPSPIIDIVCRNYFKQQRRDKLFASLCTCMCEWVSASVCLEIPRTHVTMESKSNAAEFFECMRVWAKLIDMFSHSDRVSHSEFDFF